MATGANEGSFEQMWVSLRRWLLDHIGPERFAMAGDVHEEMKRLELASSSRCSYRESTTDPDVCATCGGASTDHFEPSE